MPIKEAITTTLEDDSVISYQVLNEEKKDSGGKVWYSALVKDSSSQTVEKKGVIKFHKTGDGLWVYSK